MKGIFAKAEKRAKSVAEKTAIRTMMNSKGQLGLNLARGFVLALFGLILVGVVVVIAINYLGNANVATAGSQEANVTTNILRNGSAGIGALFNNSTTWFVLLGLVIIILILAVILRVTGAFGGGAGGGGL